MRLTKAQWHFDDGNKSVMSITPTAGHRVDAVKLTISQSHWAGIHWTGWSILVHHRQSIIASSPPAVPQRMALCPPSVLSHQPPSSHPTTNNNHCSITNFIYLLIYLFMYYPYHIKINYIIHQDRVIKKDSSGITGSGQHMLTRNKWHISTFASTVLPNTWATFILSLYLSHNLPQQVIWAKLMWRMIVVVLQLWQSV